MAQAGIVYVGTDDGVTILSDPGGTGRWRKIGQAFTGQIVLNVLALSPLEVLAATTRQGVARSTDGGQNWQTVLKEDIVTLVSDPEHPDTIYAVDAVGPLHRSTDGGQTWQTFPAPEPSSPLPAPLLRSVPPHLYLTLEDQVWINRKLAGEWEKYGAEVAAIRALAASPSQPEQLYVVASGQVYRLDDNHQWQCIAPATEQLTYAGALTVLAGKQETLLTVRVDRGGTPQFVRSDDDGATWEDATIELGDYPRIGRMNTLTSVHYHRDHAWAGGDEGLLLRSIDRGRTWQIIQRELYPILSIAAVRLL